MTNKTIKLSIPHRLSQEEATRRLHTGVAELKQKFGSQVANVDERWSANHMDFRFASLGQAVTGRLDVEASEVRVEVDLPWMLAMLAEKFRGRIEQDTKKLLEKK